MIHVWGLVASGKAKKLISHGRHQDRGVFRPSYGSLGGRLTATHHTPILLQSATCRPEAVTSIQRSLRMTPENINIFYAELTRPKIRLLRFPMKKLLRFFEDLLELFPHKSDTPDKKILPTLIYSPSRNLTNQVMKVMNQA
jgi:superfamily II DNA helicase RecQ